MNPEGKNKIENDVTDFSTETKTSQSYRSREINLVNVFVKEEYIENEERYICDAHERNDMLQVDGLMVKKIDTIFFLSISKFIKVLMFINMKISNSY
ncbi:hypothetical protein Anas_12470 [Armadillidium nasatum]|uniref:Uncharacterized protein n=1 Tax=Armadillidium nasatum TaxID=96803 RepID=A0A5N5TAC5_9CRUS|nr:hypothetical protein Anas_12470 [Armadillidium nasatum]